MRKHMKTVFICMAVAVVVLSLQMGAFAMKFTDVPITASYYKAVDKLSNEGVIQGRGDGTFGPFDKTTRAEFCAFVARADGYDGESGVSTAMPFKDVERGNWAEGYISYCYDKGYINGMSDISFAPDENVTYEQAIKIIVCVSGVGSDELSKAGPEWYSGFINTARVNNLLDMVGYEIGKTAPRSFVAQVIYNAMNIKGVLDDQIDNGDLTITDDNEVPEVELIYERPENAPPEEIDFEQQLRDQLDIDASGNEAVEELPRYDEGSERSAG